MVDKYVREALRHISTGKVLDIGCGQGKEAIFLAENNFEVTALDLSESGIKRLLETSKQRNVKIKGVVGDVCNFQFKEKYNLIICLSTLQFLKQEDVIRTIDKIKKSTKDNGIIVITVFTKDNPRKDFSYLFEKGELESYYKNWEILKYKEYKTPPEKHGKDGKWHTHNVAAIIVRKPTLH